MIFFSDVLKYNRIDKIHFFFSTTVVNKAFWLTFIAAKNMGFRKNI